jgi:ABC-2 type transport system ATP-binding protein
VIEVERLTKRYGSTVAVDDLSFKVQPARVTGFLGPNGAGKTTTLRVVLGLARATSGGATIGGRAYRDLETPMRRVGAVLETANYHPGRSGRSHLRVVAHSAGLPRSRVDEVLQLVAMTEMSKRRMKGYSMGMRQRLGLAAALLGDPEVLILDEPANGLDPAGIRWLRDFLRSLADDGRTVLVSSHVLSEMELIADDVVVIHRGKFVAQASTKELASRATSRVRVRSPQADRLGELLGQQGAAVERLDEDRLAVSETTSETIGELAAANGIVLHELVPEAATLEEAFLELTGGESTA